MNSDRLIDARMQMRHEVSVQHVPLYYVHALFNRLETFKRINMSGCSLMLRWICTAVTEYNVMLTVYAKPVANKS